jgi:hypothetical protein
MQRSIIIYGTFGAVLLSSLFTSAPGLSWLDAGDFVTASSILGVPHATGFPSYTLLGHLVTYLPLGNYASRIALLSAVFSGLTALGLILTVRYYTKSTVELLAVSIALFIVFIGSPTLYIHARVPEIYGSNCALVVFSLLCLERFWSTGDRRWCLGLALLAGLGIANHALFRIWVPLFAIALFVHRDWRRDLALLPWFFVLLVFGTMAFLYLPAAALGEPAHNWGDPSSFGRLWDHINAAEIRRSFREEMTPTLFTLRAHFQTLLSQLWNSLGPILLFGIVGCALCAGRFIARGGGDAKARLGFLVGCLIASDSVYAVAINPMGLQDLQNGQITTVLLAAVGALCLTRLFLALLMRVVPVGLSRVFSVAVVPLGLLPFVGHDYHGLYRDWSGEDLAVVHTSLARPDSITALVSDSMTSAHLYLSIVLEARPDMAFFGRSELTHGRRFAYTAARQPIELIEKETMEKWLRRGSGISQVEFLNRTGAIVERHLDRRRIYWEASVTMADLKDHYSVSNTWPFGYVVRTEKKSHLNPCEPLDRSYCQRDEYVQFARTVFARNKKKEFDRFMAGQWAVQGKHQLRAGAYMDAAKSYLKAIDLAPFSDAWRTNLAVCLAAMGRFPEALAMVEEAIELDPLSKTAVKNGILYATKLGDIQKLKRLRTHAEALQIPTIFEPSTDTR